MVFYGTYSRTSDFVYRVLIHAYLVIRLDGLYDGQIRQELIMFSIGTWNIYKGGSAGKANSDDYFKLLTVSSFYSKGNLEAYILYWLLDVNVSANDGLPRNDGELHNTRYSSKSFS